MNQFLAAVLSLQDKHAQETFRRIEAVINTSKTLTIKVRCEGMVKTADADASYTVSGTMTLGGDNRVYRQLHLSERGKDYNRLLICDGIKAHSRTELKVAL